MVAVRLSAVRRRSSSFLDRSFVACRNLRSLFVVVVVVDDDVDALAASVCFVRWPRRRRQVKCCCCWKLEKGTGRRKRKGLWHDRLNGRSITRSKQVGGPHSQNPWMGGPQTVWRHGLVLPQSSHFVPTFFISHFSAQVALNIGVGIRQPSTTISDCCYSV